jgi:phosphatidylserine/phosphatidylglycerophosphate/cardiolipin synthase-like enzyme
MKSHKPYLKLLNSEEYYQKLLSDIGVAKERIFILSMTFGWGEKMEIICAELQKAHDRGLKITIVADNYYKLAVLRSKFYKHSRIDRLKRTNGLIKHINNTVGTFSLVGSIGINPFKKRMHIKFSVVDDKVFTFGGINFMDESFDFNDYMMAAEDRGLADYLCGLGESVINGNLSKDISLELDDKNRILIDSGIPGRSIIYETACKLAKEASEIYCTSQMCPSGELAGMMKTKKYHCYFNHARDAAFPTNLSIIFDNKNRLKNSYQKNPYMHAKCLLFVGKDGKKQLISGSHNFSWRGVAYGTKEMALYSSDEVIWDSLYEYIHREVA